MIRIKLKEILEERNISMSKLSRMADVNYTTVRDAVNNTRRDPSLTTLDRLAKALGLSIPDIIEDVPDDLGTQQ